MKDVQGQKDNRNVELKKVGVLDLKWPVIVKDKNLGSQHTVASLSLSVGLSHHERGTHMSRFVEVVKDLKAISIKDVENMLDNLKEKLGAEKAFCTIRFDYFVDKPSPVSGIISHNCVNCCFDCEKDEDFKFSLEVKVPVTTLCPCSKEISEYGAHNQRAFVTIKISTSKMIWIEDLIEIAEKCASSPVYSLLKRVDEKYVTEKAYENPMFVEDVVREAALLLENNKNIGWYSVYVESIESIHNHNAFAYTEKGCLI